LTNTLHSSNQISFLSTQTPSTNLYVKPLLPEMTEDDLRVMFENFGTVITCKVMIDRETGKSRQIGFVRYKTKEEAKMAIEEMNNVKLDENSLPLLVKYSDTKEQKDFRKYFRTQKILKNDENFNFEYLTPPMYSRQMFAPPFSPMYVFSYQSNSPNMYGLSYPPYSEQGFPIYGQQEYYNNYDNPGSPILNLQQYLSPPPYGPGVPTPDYYQITNEDSVEKLELSEDDEELKQFNQEIPQQEFKPPSTQPISIPSRKN